MIIKQRREHHSRPNTDRCQDARPLLPVLILPSNTISMVCVFSFDSAVLLQQTEPCRDLLRKPGAAFEGNVTCSTTEESENKRAGSSYRHYSSTQAIGDMHAPRTEVYINSDDSDLPSKQRRSPIPCREIMHAYRFAASMKYT